MSRALVRLAVLGDPLGHTRSPDLHRAGLDALGLSCESRALPTPAGELDARLHELAEQGYRGANLTNPLKEPALACVSRVSQRARRARSINTVGFERDHWWGETTDGQGFVDLLVSLARAPQHQRVILLGAGGAARSLAVSLAEAGADAIVVAARDPRRASVSWTGIAGPTLHAWQSSEIERAFEHATLIVNAAPIETEDMPFGIERTRGDALLVDLRYARELTPWVMRARALDRTAYDGLGLLAYQARRSLSLWTGQDVPIEPLAKAVGWPR